MPAAESLTVLHRTWRAIPAGPRRAALRILATAAAPCRDPTPPATSQGVVIAGEMTRVSGLGEAARLLEAGLRTVCDPVHTTNLAILRRPSPRALPDHAALILHVNAPSIPLMLARASRHFLRNRHVIGVWNWELESLPTSWSGAKRFVHEIWAPSAFTRNAIETRYPGMVRLVPYPLAALPLPETPAQRDLFDLPRYAVVTTVIANLGASFARKNPLAAIAAHRAAFANRLDRILVLKLTGGAAFPADMARLTDAIGAAPNIRLIDATWPAETLRSLLASTDILLSLHRAEGFGLVPAEAMLRGIPVIATGWSGNLQFMNETSAALVTHRLVPVSDPHGAYDGATSLWAEPNIDHAAELLRELADNPARRAGLGAAGRAYATAALSDAPLRAALARIGIGEASASFFEKKEAKKL